MSISICLSKPNPFYPGQVLEGKVICFFQSSKKIKGIHLKMKGEEHTRWSEQVSHYNSRTKRTEFRTIYYSGNNKFVALQTSLSGEVTIDSGRYEFPFQFIIPQCVPSSYQGIHGGIRFSLKAKIVIPWGLDSKDEKIFNVFAPVDFNTILNPIELNPAKLENQSNSLFSWFSKGSVKMEVYLNKKAFILGEKICIRIHIINMSKNSVKEVFVKLKKHIIEKCTSPRHAEKYDRKTILQHVDTGVGAHSERIYNVELQLTNDLDLPNFNNCQLHSISHTLKVKADVSGFHRNVKIETGVTLGHIPLGGTHVYSIRS